MQNKSSTKRRPAKEKFWRTHLAAQKNSGLSRAEYCRRTNLSPSTFDWWKRELRAEQPTSVELVPVKLIGDLAAGHSRLASSFSGLTVVTGTGHRIEVAENFHPAVLERLLQALGRA